MDDSGPFEPGVIFVYRIAFVAAIGGFLFGFDLGMIGVANLYLKDQFHLNDAQLGLATASAGIGCILGPFLGAWLCDAVGRKRTMIAAAILLALSAVVTAVPDWLSGSSAESTMTVFNIFRAVGGLGVGLCSIASPMYIAEMAPPTKRGRLADDVGVVSHPRPRQSRLNYHYVSVAGDFQRGLPVPGADNRLEGSGGIRRRCALAVHGHLHPFVSVRPADDAGNQRPHARRNRQVVEKVTASCYNARLRGLNYTQRGQNMPVL